VVEVARNGSQFACYLVVTATVSRDGIDDTVARFASALGVENLEEIDATTLATGDEPTGLVRLPQFQQDVPLASCGAGFRYDGWFPAPTSEIPWWESASEFELPDEPNGLPAHYATMPWLQAGEKVKLFEGMLRNNDFKGAWLALNSRGWRIRDARQALARLAAVCNDSEFGMLADAWISVAEGDQSY